MKSDITGVILAGGKSSRIGSDKSFLNISGEQFISRILSTMQSVFSEVIISTNNSEPYKIFGVELVQDIISSIGPLSGIYSTLKYADTEKIFVSSCDMPLIDADIIKNILNINTDAQVILPVINLIPQYDFGIYEKSILPQIENLISSRDEKVSLKKLIPLVKTTLIKVEELPAYNEWTFLNINTIENYQRLKEMHANSSPFEKKNDEK